jgi:hypothetical protein
MIAHERVEDAPVRHSGQVRGLGHAAIANPGPYDTGLAAWACAVDPRGG